MILTCNNDLNAVNEKFNFFHDGILRKVEVISGNKFMLNWSWEPKKIFVSKEDEFAAVYRRVDNRQGVMFQINHYNYNCPFEPYNRIVAFYAPRAIDVLGEIGSLVGNEIFEIGFAALNDLVECYIICPNNSTCRSRENGIRKTLFKAPRIRVTEK